MLVEIVTIEARNNSYPALQYPGIVVFSSQIQVPNALFLTSCMLVFHNSMEPCFIFLICYFLTINIKYFWQITDSKFLPENIVKLSMERAQVVKNYIKFMQLSNDQL